MWKSRTGTLFVTSRTESGLERKFEMKRSESSEQYDSPLQDGCCVPSASVGTDVHVIKAKNVPDGNALSGRELL